MTIDAINIIYEALLDVKILPVFLKGNNSKNKLITADNKTKPSIFLFFKIFTFF